MKKVLNFMLTLCMVLMLFAVVPATVSAESGTCGDNLTWDLTDGVLTISGTGSMYTYSNSPWNRFGDSLKTVRISEGVTSIGGQVFLNCTGITSVTIPNTVTAISSRAFVGCTGLTSVTIPDSVTSIGSSAFYNCTGLTSITIPDSVTNIGSNAFMGCDNLKKCHITDIAKWCEIELGNTYANPIFYARLNGNGGNIYLNNKSIGDIIIPEGVSRIGDYVFAGSRMTSCEIPDSVTEIGKAAFYLNGRLDEIVIPESVVSIGGSAFANCTSLKTAILPNGLTILPSEIFSHCTKLEKVKIPSGVTSIGYRAFYACSNLGDEIVIPKGVSVIANETFFSCKMLKNIYLPESIESIGKSAFYACSVLENVFFEGNVDKWDKVQVLDNNKKLLSARVSFMNGDTAPDLFYAIDGSEAIITRCKADAVGTVVIPSTVEDYEVTKLDDGVFYNCKEIQSITVTNSINYIGAEAFEGCDGLSEICYIGTKQEWDSIEIAEQNEKLYSIKLQLYGATVDGNSYLTLTEAIENAETGSVITLMGDNEGEGVVIDKDVVIDLNGNTYSFTIGVGSEGTESNGFQILNGNTVEIKNGTLNVAEESKDKFYILVQNYANLTLTDVTLDGTNLDKWSLTDGDSYVLSNNSGNVTIEGETNIIANDEGDKAFALDVCQYGSYEPPIVMVNTSGKIDGNIEVSKEIADNITIVDGIYNFDVTEYCREDLKAMLSKDGTYSIVSAFEAESNENLYRTLADAIAATENGTIKLLGDTSVTGSLTIAKGKNITIDLNGNTITGTDTTTKNFGLFNNNGTLTIEDSVGGGAIELTATVNSGWNRYSAVISNNPGGVLVVNGGRIEHLGGTDMAYGIDALTNSNIAPVETTINGGVVKSTYRGIRQFLNSTATLNKLTINGGVVEGENKAIFFHDPSVKANVGELTVGEDAELKGGVYLFVTAGSTEWPVNVSISANAVDEVTSKNVPEGYGVLEENGVYTVAEGVCTIIFVADGEVISEKVYRNGAEVEVPKAPVKGGYVFTGWDSGIVPADGNTTYTAQYEPVAVYEYPFKDILTLRTNNVNYDANKKQITVDMDRYQLNVASSTYGFAIVPNDGETVEITYNRDNGTAGVSTFKAYSSDKYSSYITGVNAENGGGAYGKQPVYIIDRANGTRVYLDIKITRGDGSTETLTAIMRLTDFATEGDVDITKISALRAEPSSFVLDNDAKTIYYETKPGVTSAGFAVSVGNGLTATTRPRRVLTAKSGMNLAHGDIKTAEKDTFDRYVVARRSAGTTQTYQVKVHGGEDGLTYTWYTVTVVFK